MQCPRCQRENPTGQKFCGACGTSLASPNHSGPPRASYADLERTLSEALEQQTATADVLRVIASAPTDLERVLQTIVATAAPCTPQPRPRIKTTSSAMLTALPASAARIGERLSPTP